MAEIPKELLAEYRKLAKQADQRLVRLERYSEQEHYKGVLTYSYARAIRDIETYSGEGATRFNTKPPEDVKQLRDKIADIKTFLEAPTSTKKGITNIYKKRAKTVNEKYGTNFTWQDLANYYESANSEKLSKEYGSKVLIRAIGIIKKIGPKPEDIKNAKKKNVKVSDDEVLNEIAKKLLKNGYTSEKLFSKPE